MLRDPNRVVPHHGHHASLFGKRQEVQTDTLGNGSSSLATATLEMDLWVVGSSSYYKQKRSLTTESSNLFHSCNCRHVRQRSTVNQCCSQNHLNQDPYQTRLRQGGREQVQVQVQNK